MIRIVLVTIVPWTGRIMKGIIFITLCAAACHLSKGLSTLGRPHSLTVFFQISKIGIGSEIVCLQSQTDLGKISRTGREMEILRLIQRGFLSKEIAEDRKSVV